RAADGKIDIRSLSIAVGVIAIWAASNFAFAFSVFGGDTLAAFAAGCPVVFKAHACHPMLSELIGTAVAAGVRKAKFPDGFFALIQSSVRSVADVLLAHRAIRAGAFTGSRSGGDALAGVARQYGKQFYAEQSSVNPGWILPEALAADPV